MNSESVFWHYLQRLKNICKCCRPSQTKKNTKVARTKQEWSLIYKRLFQFTSLSQGLQYLITIWSGAATLESAQIGLQSCDLNSSEADAYRQELQLLAIGTMTCSVHSETCWHYEIPHRNTQWQSLQVRIIKWYQMKIKNLACLNLAIYSSWGL